MHRALAIFSLLACTYLEFQFYPGHTYLRGESQVLAPMIERLQFPGLLSRDSVATHPILRYTVYDETTLSLERVGRLSIRDALALQQFAARLAFLSGVFLLASSASLSYLAALVIAALTGLGAALPGVDLQTVDREAVPYAIALGFALLSAGLAAKHRVMLAGLFAGIAFVYSPAIAVPFWLCLLAAVSFVPPIRPALRPLLTILVIAVLLFGNLLQLQPGAPGSNPLFDHASGDWVALVKARAPSALVWTWAAHQIWLYLAMAVTALCAAYRLRRRLNRLTRWLLLFGLMTGLLAIPATAFVQLVLPWAFWMYFEPARALLLTVVLSMSLCGMAAALAVQRRSTEALIWMMAFTALLLTPMLNRDRTPAVEINEPTMASLASWAQQNTWGGSLFFFAGNRSRFDPGRFRALSLRPVYVDWPGGDLTRCFEDFAVEWSTRWKQANQDPAAASQVRRLLPEPIDYYVLPVDQELHNAKAVFFNSDIRVYEARDLRTTSRHSN